jgi:WD40 repeat protein
LPGEDENRARWWNPASGQPIPLRVKDPKLLWLGWLADGKTLLACDPAGKFHVHDPVTLECLRSLENDGGKGDLPCSVTLAPDGRMLAKLSYEGCVGVWDTDSGKRRWQVPSEPTLSAVQWSPDSRRIVEKVLSSPSGEEWVCPWDLASGRLTAARSVASGPGRIAHSPDGQALAVSTHTAVEVLEAATLARLTDPLPVRFVLGWSPDGKLLACTGGKDVQVWKVAERELRSVFQADAEVVGFAWSPDGKTLAVGCDDNVIRLWDGESDRAWRQRKGHGNPPVLLEWAPDGKGLASASPTGAGLFEPFLLTWEVNGDKPAGHLNADNSLVRAMRWLGDGAVVGLDDSGYIRRWEKSSNRGSVMGRIFPGFSGHFSPDGAWIASGHGWEPARARCFTSAVWLWKAANGRPTGAVVPLLNEGWLAVSPDGHFRGSPGVERELVYVVQTDNGQRTLTHDEFGRRYGWKNDPGRVRLLDTEEPELPDLESFP